MPSRCAPSGVGRPMPSVVSMRNWCASTYHGCAPLSAEAAAAVEARKGDLTAASEAVAAAGAVPVVMSYWNPVERYGVELRVASVQDYLDDGRLRERADGTRNPLQTLPLLDAITQHRFDGVFGGGRRDEDKARAKERIVSLRDDFGQWDPKNQRPELWRLYNTRHRPGEHVRVFPLSNWTELDIWRYIAREGIELPSLYYAHERDVFERDGMLLTPGPWSTPRAGETITRRTVR